MCCNNEIKEKMKSRGVRQWEIAAFLGISETTMCRKMRFTLDPNFRSQVLNAIETLGSNPGAAKVQNVVRDVIIDK